MAKEKQEKGLETVIKADASVDVSVEEKEKNMVSETTQNLSASNLIKEFDHLTWNYFFLTKDLQNVSLE